MTAQKRIDLLAIEPKTMLKLTLSDKMPEKEIIVNFSFLRKNFMNEYEIVCDVTDKSDGYSISLDWIKDWEVA